MSQQQMQLAKLVQEKNEQAGQLFADRLNSTLFPTEEISDKWIMAARAAIVQSSPLSHRLPLKEFADVVVAASSLDPSMNNNKLNLFEFGVLSNALETVSPNDLCMHADSYKELVEEANRHIETHGKMVAKIRHEIELEVEAEFKLKAAAVNNLKPVADA